MKCPGLLRTCKASGQGHSGFKVRILTRTVSSMFAIAHVAAVATFSAASTPAPALRKSRTDFTDISSNVSFKASEADFVPTCAMWTCAALDATAVAGCAVMRDSTLGAPCGIDTGRSAGLASGIGTGGGQATAVGLAGPLALAARCCRSSASIPASLLRHLASKPASSSRMLGQGDGEGLCSISRLTSALTR